MHRFFSAKARVIPSICFSNICVIMYMGMRCSFG